MDEYGVGGDDKGEVELTDDQVAVELDDPFRLCSGDGLVKSSGTDLGICSRPESVKVSWGKDILAELSRTA